MTTLTKIQLLVPAITTAGGREIIINSARVPERMAPHIHHIRLALDLAAKQDILPGEQRINFVQFDRLRIIDLEEDSHTVVLDYSGREQTKFKALKDLNIWQPRDRAKLEKAFELSQERFADFYRKDGEPYLPHCVDVPYFLATTFDIRDINVVLAGITHDYLEPPFALAAEESAAQEFYRSQLEQNFGPRVAQLVKTLTREVMGVPSAEYVRRIVNDKDAASIKSADVLTNAMKLFQLVDVKERQRLTHKYFVEVQGVLLPWARSDVGSRLVADNLSKWLQDNLTVLDYAAYLNAHPETERPRIRRI